MANKRGWWKLTVTNVDDDEQIELSDADNEHIQDLIAQGYTEGEIVKDEEVEDGEDA